MIHEFGWAMDDWDGWAGAPSSAICWNAPARSPAAISPIPATRTCPTWRGSAFPLAEVGDDGSLVITKVAGSGGAVTARPARNSCSTRCTIPADTSSPTWWRISPHVRSRRSAPDRVRVSGGRGTPRTGTLKVSVGYVDGYIGEGQISYAGPGAVARGRLALRDRRGAAALDRRAGQRNALRPDRRRCPARRRSCPAARREPYEVRVRVAGPHREPARGGADRQRGRNALHQRPGRRRRRVQVGARDRGRGVGACCRANSPNPRSASWRCDR